jgi:hypothetical protein
MASAVARSLHSAGAQMRGCNEVVVSTCKHLPTTHAFVLWFAPRGALLVASCHYHWPSSRLSRVPSIFDCSQRPRMPSVKHKHSLYASWFIAIVHTADPWMEKPASKSSIKSSQVLHTGQYPAKLKQCRHASASLLGSTRLASCLANT